MVDRYSPLSRATRSLRTHMDRELPVEQTRELQHRAEAVDIAAA
jgi:hypothetical protein